MKSEINTIKGSFIFLLLANYFVFADIQAADQSPLAPGYGSLEFALPEAGSYQLPPMGVAADGNVLESNGKAIKLHDLLGDKIVLLSFVYSTCTDVNGALLNVLPNGCGAAQGQVVVVARIVLAVGLERPGGMDIGTRVTVRAGFHQVEVTDPQGTAAFPLVVDADEQRLVVQGRYTSSSTTESETSGRVVEVGETAQLNGIQIMVTGVTYQYDRPEAPPGFGFYLVDYQIQNVGAESFDTSRLEMVLADDLGNLAFIHGAPFLLYSTRNVV